MTVGDATVQALRLLLSGDGELWRIIALSLMVSGAALLAATPLSLISAYLLHDKRFIGRRWTLIVLHGLLSFPTVVVGLILYMTLSRQGPLGAWGLLFTPTAMAIGQLIIAYPILTVFSFSALQSVDARARETALTVGAGFWRTALAELQEARAGIIAGLFTGFGRVISEVGCALMVGGNIAGKTRNITTAITLETGKGKFAEGIALGLVLVLLVVTASAVVFFNSKRSGR